MLVVIILGVLLVAVDANELLWKMVQQTMLYSGVWRLLSLPFVLAMVIWATCAVMVWRSQTAAVASEAERAGSLRETGERAGR